MKRNLRSNQNQKKLKKSKYINKEYTDISQINEHLFVGNRHIANDQNRLEEHGITCVVNCSAGLEHFVDAYTEDIKWLHLPMYDCSFTGDLESYIPDAIEFIDEAINEGHKILIHCHAGISRSTSITIAYLMYKHNLRYERAYSRVKAKRYCCKPNSRFVTQLKNYDFSLL